MLYVNPETQSGFKAMELAPGAKGRETEALKQFEQLFLFQMLKEMRKTVPEYGVFESGSQKEYFEEMMDDFLAGEMASSGQFGVAKQMSQQLHVQEKSAADSDRTATSRAAGELAPRGIQIDTVHQGIPRPGGEANGIAIQPPVPVEKPLNRGQSIGLPLSRAHERYQQHQNP